MILYIADWFAQLNHKMGGDLEKIRIVGRYFIEVFKACGIDLSNTEIVWASDFITKHEPYWPRVLDIATHTTLKRVNRCCQIMGRKEGDALSASQIIYPCMQVADIFELGVDIAQLGVDQRKCNMLARDYAGRVKLTPPTSVAHHMLMGLKGLAQGKMSKSIPDAAVFMEDSEEEVNRKIRAALCNDSVEGNPIFEYIRYIILRWFGEFTVEGKTYKTHEELAEDFGNIDKLSLKTAVAAKINEILEPVRKHFAKPEMRALADLVASFQVTR
jgi:tyrosyl-tRNA synthetase